MEAPIPDDAAGGGSSARPTHRTATSIPTPVPRSARGEKRAPPSRQPPQTGAIPPRPLKKSRVGDGEGAAGPSPTPPVVDRTASVLPGGEVAARRVVAALLDANGPARVQLASYEDFMRRIVPHIVAEHRRVSFCCVARGEMHELFFDADGLTFGLPNHKETDGEVAHVTPEQCRLRGLSYVTPVFVDVTHVVRHVTADALVAMGLDPDKSQYVTPSEEQAQSLPMKDKPTVYRQIPLCLIPTMVRSSFCHMGRRPTGAPEEDPRDTGGYFIICGQEKAVQCQEGPSHNHTSLLAPPRKLQGKYLLKCETRSRHEEKYRSTSTLPAYVTRSDAWPAIFIKLPFLSTDLPLCVLLRLLTIEAGEGEGEGEGETDAWVAALLPMAGSAEATSAFYGGAGGHAPIPRARLERQLRAMLVHETRGLSVGGLYAWVDAQVDQRGGGAARFGGGASARRTDGSPEKQRSYIRHLVSNEFLPHLGSTASEDAAGVVAKKVAFLGVSVRRLLVGHARLVGGGPWVPGGAPLALDDVVDDRDDYSRKGLVTPGASMGILVRRTYLTFTKSLRARLARLVREGKFVNIVDSVNCRHITYALLTAWKTGNWNAHQKTGTHVGVTQTLSRTNRIAFVSQLTRVNTPTCREVRAPKQRQLHSSQFGIFCPAETPEGQSCGLNTTLGASVRVGTPTAMVVAALERAGAMVPYDAAGAAAGAAVVEVNGDLVGMCARVGGDGEGGGEGGWASSAANVTAVLALARGMRRRMQLPHDASVSRARHFFGVTVCTDAGAVLRPLFILGALRSLPAVLAHCEAKPHVPLWRELLAVGVVEYVDKTEEAELLIASSAVRVAERAALPEEARGPAFTHCAIHEMLILGYASAAIPFSAHNQAPRNVYQSSMAKQAIALSMLTYRRRANTSDTMYVPTCVQRPLVNTFAEEAASAPELSTGLNAIVAIACYGGFNQEDACIMSKAAVERGMFRNVSYTATKAEEHTVGNNKEVFAGPDDLAGCVGVKRADYRVIGSDGVPPVGARVGPGTVLIGKMATSTDSTGGGVDADGNGVSAQVRRDNSVVYDGIDGCVDRVISTTTGDGMRARRVVVRAVRVPEVGNKFSSRHGQKGTVGLLMAQEDMPFDPLTGMTPDIIINPHAIPSRMTVAQLIECITGKAYAVTGEPRFGDGTPFRGEAVTDAACAALRASGMDGMGKTRMMNGTTGEMLEAHIFMGPVYTQSLHHLVSNKVHARHKGPVQAMTRQPLEGRNRKGGLRYGEMENDATKAHGAVATLQDRTFIASDYFTVPICGKCGALADGKHDEEQFGASVRGARPYCRGCKTHDVRTAAMPYATKLIGQELNALGIRLIHELDDGPVAAASAAATPVSE